METLLYVVIAVVAAVALTSAGFKISQARAAGQPVPWDQIRPILSEMFVEIIKVIDMKDKSYEVVEEYAVNYVHMRIQSATFLSPVEKAMVSKELIRKMISPRLKELYTKRGK